MTDAQTIRVPLAAFGGTLSAAVDCIGYGLDGREWAAIRSIFTTGNDWVTVRAGKSASAPVLFTSPPESDVDAPLPAPWNGYLYMTVSTVASDVYLKLIRKERKCA